MVMEYNTQVADIIIAAICHKINISYPTRNLDSKTTYIRRFPEEDILTGISRIEKPKELTTPYSVTNYSHLNYYYGRAPRNTIP